MDDNEHCLSSRVTCSFYPMAIENRDAPEIREKVVAHLDPLDWI